VLRLLTPLDPQTHVCRPAIEPYVEDRGAEGLGMLKVAKQAG
jgi:hypothetical protein